MLSVRGIFKKGVVFPIEEIEGRENQSVIITFLEDLEEPVENTAPESEIDPIKALRGCAKGANLTEKLLESRREDLELEEAKWRKR